MPEANIVLMTREEATAELVSTALDSSQPLVLSGICEDTSELRSQLSRLAAQVTIVDIDTHSAQVLRDLSLIVTSHPETRVVVISRDFNERLILEAMQAGARHFLRKNCIGAELEEVLQRLLSETMKDVTLGEIVTVLSASGGCGATTVAVNLANEFRLTSSEPVLAIDLDVCYGTVSDYLGIKGQYGIADVLRRKGSIDKDLIESSAYSYTKDFHVLLSPASTNGHSVAPLQYESLGEALEVCKEQYGYTVVDAPRVPGNVAIDLAAISKLVVIVFQLTVKDLRFTRSLAASLSENGIPSDKIIPLANRVSQRGPLVRLEDSQKAVGLDSFARIRSDWRSAMKSVNRGRPLAEVAHRSGLRKDLRKLATRIHSHKKNGNGTGAG